MSYISAALQHLHYSDFCAHCVTLTFAERNRLSFSLSGNKPLSAN